MYHYAMLNTRQQDFDFHDCTILFQRAKFCRSSKIDMLTCMFDNAGGSSQTGMKTK